MRTVSKLVANCRVKHRWLAVSGAILSLLGLSCLGGWLIQRSIKIEVVTA